MELNDLIKRARNGDCDAFAEVFERYRPLLYSLSCRMVGYSDADDVVMDTYLKAWRSLPGFQGRCALKTWLIKVFRNCATDLLRKRNRERARISSESASNDDRGPLHERIADDDRRSPDREAELDDLGEHLRLALAELSDDHRTAILLREADGLSYGEIANATGVGIGTVMSRLFYAKRRLRRILSDKGITQ